MGDIEAYIEEKPAGSHLKLKVFCGWVGSNQCSSSPTNADAGHELRSRAFKTKIEPQPPPDAYNPLRVDISSLLAPQLCAFMALEATVESTPVHRETCYVLLVPKEYKGGTVMGDIEAYIEGKLAGCHLKAQAEGVLWQGWI